MCGSLTVQILFAAIWVLGRSRMRGERVSPRIRSGPLSGSSPHARGTRRQPVWWGRQFQFIPAGAVQGAYDEDPREWCERTWRNYGPDGVTEKGWITRKGAPAIMRFPRWPDSSM